MGTGTAENIYKNSDLTDRDEEMHELGYLCAYEEFVTHLENRAVMSFSIEKDEQAKIFRTMKKEFSQRASELRNAYIKKYHPRNPEPLKNP